MKAPVKFTSVKGVQNIGGDLIFPQDFTGNIKTDVSMVLPLYLPDMCLYRSPPLKPWPIMGLALQEQLKLKIQKFSLKLDMQSR